MKHLYLITALTIIIAAIVERTADGQTILALPASIAAIYVAFTFFHLFDKKSK